MLPLPIGVLFPEAHLLSRQGLRPARHYLHNGLDFAQQDDRGHSIFGTPGGVVAEGDVAETCFAGSARCSGYGNGLLVKHGDDIFSWYGHLSKILVEPGDHVLPLEFGGDPAYEVGNTFGTVSDPTRTLAVPHVHFELVHEGWPFSSRNAAARYDVMHELAAGGVGMSGGLLVSGLDPFEYDEPSVLLALEESKAAGGMPNLDTEPAPPELRWSRTPAGLILAGIGVVSLALILAIRRASRRRRARR